MTWAEQTKEYETALLADLSRIIKIPSVLDDKTSSPQTPFGVDMMRALAEMEALAFRDGFRFGRVDNMVTWIEYGPSDAVETIGILTHIDVVPAGDGWKTNPFQLTQIDQYLYGRGTADMKADLMAAYYALKFLKDQQVKVQKKIRLIIGTDEENGWRDLPRYFAQEGEPCIGFSPDGAFPVVNGEKAFQTVQLRFSGDSAGSTVLQRFMAGDRINVVPGEARARVLAANAVEIGQAFERYLKKYPFLKGEFSVNDGSIRLQLFGQQAHSAYPFDGKNAGTYLAMFLNTYPFTGDAKAFLQLLTEYHNDIAGQHLGLAYSDVEMGDLTVNVAIMRFNHKGQGNIALNFRYPQGIQLPIVLEHVKQHLAGLPATITVKAGSMEPHLVPLTDPLVGVLSMAYASEVGMYAAPRTSSGGSYARLLKRGVAFGGQFPDVMVTSHQANERVPLANLTRTMGVFVAALIGLEQLE